MRAGLRNGTHDAIVVGSGPNGLSAAVALAQAKRSVLVLEAAGTIGGGIRSCELTLPGFVHDIAATIYPLAAASPFFRQLDLTRYGFELVHPLAPLAHPLDDGTAALLERSIEATGETLGVDADAYRRLMGPLVADWENLTDHLLARRVVPRNPAALCRFVWRSLRSAKGFAEGVFQTDRARALFGGIAAHSALPLEQSPTAGFALFLGAIGHAVGWPMAKGGSQNLANALASCFRSLGGEIATNTPIDSLEGLPSSAAVLFDLSPHQLVQIVGQRLPGGYRRGLERYRYGPGVFKMDWALDGPVPWTAHECLRAGTVHIGGTLDEIAAAERAVWDGQHPEKPFVILAQQTLFDTTRAPQGKHTAWAYCHVPEGSTFDMSERIEGQIERFAPGFRDRILARSVMAPARLREINANWAGGVATGGVHDLRQLLARPVFRRVSYAMPGKRFFICSASTPPGGGVHGMCGYLAARAALRVRAR